MLKFDHGKIIYSTRLRKVLLDLMEETNYSGESEMNIEIPVKKKSFRYKRYLKF